MGEKKYSFYNSHLPFMRRDKGAIIQNRYRCGECSRQNERYDRGVEFLQRYREIKL